MSYTWSCLSIVGVVITVQSWGQQPTSQTEDEAAIRKSVESYVQAFNKHDAQALAEHWSPDAVYRNRTTGEEVVGRTAIAEQFAALLEKQPDLKVEVNIE